MERQSERVENREKRLEVDGFCSCPIGLVHQLVPYVGESLLLDRASYWGGFMMVCLICKCIEKRTL